MQATHRNICDAHVGIVAAADIQLNSVAHVDHVDHFTRIRANRLQYDIEDFLAILALRRIVLDNVQHGLPVE